MGRGGNFQACLHACSITHNVWMKKLMVWVRIAVKSSMWASNTVHQCLPHSRPFDDTSKWNVMILTTTRGEEKDKKQPLLQAKLYYGYYISKRITLVCYLWSVCSDHIQFLLSAFVFFLLLNGADYPPAGPSSSNHVLIGHWQKITFFNCQLHIQWCYLLHCLNHFCTR